MILARRPLSRGRVLRHLIAGLSDSPRWHDPRLNSEHGGNQGAQSLIMGWSSGSAYLRGVSYHAFNTTGLQVLIQRNGATVQTLNITNGLQSFSGPGTAWNSGDILTAQYAGTISGTINMNLFFQP